MNNILSQKKEIKRLEKVREREEKEAEDDQAREDAEAKDRSVQEFEKTQMGLEMKRGSKPSVQKIIGFGKEEYSTVEGDVPDAKIGEKRKFELDEDELLRIAREERTKARKTIDDEKVRLLHDTIYVCDSNGDDRLQDRNYLHSGFHLSRLPRIPLRHFTPSSRKPSYHQFAPLLQPTNLTFTLYTHSSQ